MPVWPGVAPGSEQWTQKEKTLTDTPLGTVIINVVTPTLTAYLPQQRNDRKTAVIIAPGGAFVALAIDVEANGLARSLQSKGIAAFVLKYRTIEKRFEGIPPDLNMDEAGRYGMADGIQAIKVVRQHAAQWGIAPDKVGIIGFSAGAMVASAALLQSDAAARPDFAAMIYGGPFGKMPPIPAKLPPMFLAWAQDDGVARETCARFYAALTAAGHRPEAHIFSAGGHGFGTKKQGTTSDHWIDELDFWMQAHRFAQKPAGDVASEILALEHQRQAAQLAGDWRMMARINAPEFTEIGANGAIRTAADNAQGMRSGAVKFTSVEYTDLHVHAYGDTAYVTGVGHRIGVANGAPFEQHFRFTRMYARGDGAWRAVFAQNTKIEP